MDPQTVVLVVVGALVVIELVPQAGPTIGRLQHDLLSLLGDRLATSLSLGRTQQDAGARARPWSAVVADLEELTG